MQGAQNVAIDLSQELLVSEDAKKKLWFSYDSPEYFK